MESSQGYMGIVYEKKEIRQLRTDIAYRQPWQRCLLYGGGGDKK